MLRKNFNMLTMLIRTVNEAPNYQTGANGGEGFKAAKILAFVAIKEGMANGKDTVDLQFEDDQGNKFVAFTTATLFKQFASILNDVATKEEGGE
jgi:hypothetical protein